MISKGYQVQHTPNSNLEEVPHVTFLLIEPPTISHVSP
jgi:hypothetical protein